MCCLNLGWLGFHGGSSSCQVMLVLDVGCTQTHGCVKGGLESGR